MQVWGLVLGIAYRKFQKLEYCIMAHMINNSIAVSMMLLLQVVSAIYQIKLGRFRAFFL